MRSTVTGESPIKSLLSTQTWGPGMLLPLPYHPPTVVLFFLPSQYLKSMLLSKSPLLLSQFSCPHFLPEPLKWPLNGCLHLCSLPPHSFILHMLPDKSFYCTALPWSLVAFKRTTEKKKKLQNFPASCAIN